MTLKTKNDDAQSFLTIAYSYKRRAKVGRGRERTRTCIMPRINLSITKTDLQTIRHHHTNNPSGELDPTNNEMKNDLSLSLSSIIMA